MAAGEYIRKGADTFLKYPALTVLGIAGAFFSGLTAAALGSGGITGPGGFTGVMYLIYADVLVSMTVTAAMIAFIDSVVNEKDHGVLWYAVVRLPAFVGASFLAIIMVLGGLLMFVLPGIYVGVRLLFFPFFLVIEEDSALTALGSSWDVTRRRFWRVFMVIILLAVIGVGSSALLTLLPEGLMEADRLVHTAFFTPWSLAVLYHLYEDITDADT